MSIKISKEAYEKLIKEDLDFLNEHCPESLQLFAVPSTGIIRKRLRTCALKIKQRFAIYVMNAM